jgi:hypothetical protein
LCTRAPRTLIASGAGAGPEPAFPVDRCSTGRSFPCVSRPWVLPGLGDRGTVPRARVRHTGKGCALFDPPGQEAIAPAAVRAKAQSEWTKRHSPSISRYATKGAAIS